MILLPIAFGAGLVTALTPCILPVLPIVLAGGGTGGKRRPYAIVAGLVTTFTIFTLAATAVLDALDLGANTLTKIAVAMLLLLALTLVVPRAGELLERPFLFLTRRRAGDLGGGFLLGASLGVVFVPCAGPVFGAVSTLVGLHRVSVLAVFVTIAYALGAALPMLLIAHGSRTLVGRLRRHAYPVRAALGGLMAVGALVIYQGWAVDLQTKVPGYAAAIQDAIEGSALAKRELRQLRGGESRASRRAEAAAARLGDYGRAPGFLGIAHWLNTEGGRPLTLGDLRGRVVLLDFWTYSCINCIRTFPHLKAWDQRYRESGLTIVGVHTPEFEFEHDLANVRAATKRFGIRYPVALDNDYATWQAWGNQYWPAHYLIDARGHVRGAHFGEGAYAETERDIRALLIASGHRPPPAAEVADDTPRGLVTPETYLGYLRLDRYTGTAIAKDRLARYTPAVAPPRSEFTFGGAWKVEGERAVAGPGGATIRLHFQARDVYIVLGGKGTVRTAVNDRPAAPIEVDGYRLYTAVAGGAAIRTGVLELRLPRGVGAYAFTFG